MGRRTISLVSLGGLTGLLWLVPSIGTQGMGTISAPLSHPDAALIDRVPGQRAAVRATLARTDAATEAALGF